MVIALKPGRGLVMAPKPGPLLPLTGTAREPGQTRPRVRRALPQAAMVIAPKPGRCMVIALKPGRLTGPSGGLPARLAEALRGPMQLATRATR